MIIKLTNDNGCSFTFNNIPDVYTPKDMKDYLWNDVTTNFLFKSREELDSNKWKVEIISDVQSNTKRKVQRDKNRSEYSK